uniref:Uncharacterized protein n=1 Tax=Arundo donax TaxID=35708 RepID=A0A0A8YUF7_ARUDO
MSLEESYHLPCGLATRFVLRTLSA